MGDEAVLATILVHPDLQPCAREGCAEGSQFALELAVVDEGAGVGDYTQMRLCPEHVAAFMRDSQQAEARLG